MQQTDVKMSTYSTQPVVVPIGPTRVKAISLQLGTTNSTLTISYYEASGVGADFMKFDLPGCNSTGGSKTVYLQFPGEGVYTDKSLYFSTTVALPSITIYYG